MTDLDQMNVDESVTPSDCEHIYSVNDGGAKNDGGDDDDDNDKYDNEDDYDHNGEINSMVRIMAFGRNSEVQSTQ